MMNKLINAIAEKIQGENNPERIDEVADKIEMAILSAERMNPLLTEAWTSVVLEDIQEWPTPEYSESALAGYMQARVNLMRLQAALDVLEEALLQDTAV